MRLRWARAGVLGAVSALALVTLAPSFAAVARMPRRTEAARSLFERVDGDVGLFTPAAADPRLAAALARGGSSTSSFQFTPSSVPGRRRALTVAVRTRAPVVLANRDGAVGTMATSQAVAATPTALTPSAYSLGASIGWKRFAISGDVARSDGGANVGTREAVDVGVSYALNRKLTTRLAVGSERTVGGVAGLAQGTDGYSVDVGSSYRVTRNIDVTGGLRYRLGRERLGVVSDDRRDGQAVYLGTAFRF